MMEFNFNQRGTLHLPAATMVIDIRPNNDSLVINRLKVDINDIANEMRVYDVHYWRNLTEFLAFRLIPPMSDINIKALRSPDQTDQSVQPGVNPPIQKGLVGEVNVASPSRGGSPDNFQKDIDSIVNEIDRIRTNLISSIGELNAEGIPGYKDPTVRVLFLTDATSRESLASAAIYAAHLKEYFQKQVRPGRQSLLNTSVLCLNHSSEAGPPRDLIDCLCLNGNWEHIDALIISEKYREDAAMITPATQAYIAELLLYTLLITSPLGSDIPAPEIKVPAQQHNGTGGNVKGRWLSLPPETYVVGLAAIEYSARWGSRWLNYGLIAKTVEVLQDKSAEVDEEKGTKISVKNWLSDWRAQIKNALPNKVPGNIAALEAIPHAVKVANPEQGVFRANTFSLNLAQSTLNDLNKYATNVAQTYTLHDDEREQMRHGDDDDVQAATIPHTLQDAANSIPKIQQRLREWESRDLDRRRGMPLVNATVEAQQVLSNPKFFSGANGALPRAQLQLKELSTAISKFQNAYEQNPVDVEKMRKDLEDNGKLKISDFQVHLQRWPFLASFTPIRLLMAFINLLIVVLLSVVGIFSLFAWLNYAFAQTGALSGISSVLETTPLGLSTLALLAGTIALLVVLAEIIFTIARGLINQDSHALWVEFVFCIMLFALGIVGLLIRNPFAYGRLDVASTDLLSWLSFLSAWVVFVLTLAIAIVLFEACYFVYWYSHLRSERENIVEDLRSMHASHIEKVNGYIADSIALHILQRAELTDGGGGVGKYYTRVSDLNKMLTSVAKTSQMEQEQARSRLSLSLNENSASDSSGKWLSLHIRDEKLDMVPLVDGYNRLKARLEQEPEELKEFAELILRVMGIEKPAEIGNQFTEKQTTTRTSREQRRIQVLMGTLVATAIRLATDPSSTSSITQLIDLYENLDDTSAYRLPTLGILIHTLKTKLRASALQPLMSTAGAGGGAVSLVTKNDYTMATDVLALWEQMLWENKDKALHATLKQDGILPKLAQESQDKGQDAVDVMTHLRARVNPHGRGLDTGQPGEIYLLFSLTPQSIQFFQGQNNHMMPKIVSFPDSERILLLSVQHYLADPLFLPEPVAPVAQPGSGTTSAKLSVNPAALDFNVTAGITSQSVYIENSGTEPLDWSIAFETGTPSFVTSSAPAGANLAGGAHTSIDISVNTIGLPSGATYTTSLTIGAIDPKSGRHAQGSPVTIPVAINVVPVALQLSATNLSFTSVAGNNPAAQSIQLTNTDNQDLKWEVGQPSVTWLTVKPENGRNALGASSPLEFAVDITNLPAGTHYATVTITHQGGAPATVTVDLTVK
jgi:Viral BACON domain